MNFFLMFATIWPPRFRVVPLKSLISSQSINELFLWFSGAAELLLVPPRMKAKLLINS